MERTMEDPISGRALENLRWMVKLWRKGHRSGAAFDLDASESPDFGSHPDVVALEELARLGYVEIHLDDIMRACWTVGADLTEKGIRLAGEQAFDDEVSPQRFPFP